MGKPHGNFEITKLKNIIIITYYDSWNIEAAKEFFEVYKKHILKWNLGRFGVLSDLTHFTGGTPDAMEYFHQITQWAINQGQVARSVIANSEYKKYTVKTIDQNRVTMPTSMFESIDEALEWFKAFDLQ